MRGATLALALAVAACGGEPPTRSEPPPTSPVVAAAVAELAARLPQVDEDPAAATDPTLVEAVDQRLGFVTNARGALREAGFEDLTSLGPVAATALADAALDDRREPAERSAALEALALLGGPRGASALLRCTTESDAAWLRRQAYWRLGDLDQDQVVPALVLRLKYEEDWEAVAWLGRALGMHGNYAGLDGLVNVAANAPDAATREAAASLGAELAAAAGQDGAARVAWLWRIGDPDDTLVEPPRSDRYRAEVWRWIDRLDEFQLRGVDDARFVLSRLDATAAAALGRALADDVPYHRLHAAQSLGRMGHRGRAAGPDLIAALDRPGLGPTAAESLGLVGYPPGRLPLEERLASPADPSLRVAAARGLGSLALPEAAPALISAMDSEDAFPELRQACAESLLALGHADVAVPALAQALVDSRLELGPTQRALRAWFARLAADGVARAETLLAEWDAAIAERDAVVPVEQGFDGTLQAQRGALLDLLVDALPDLLRR